MYAIMETGGKQYKVSVGQVLTVEKLDVQEGASVSFDKVFMVEDAGDVKIGSPYVAGVRVTGSILAHGKAKKIVVYKYKSKKNYRRKQGHRQPFTTVKIDAIELG